MLGKAGLYADQCLFIIAATVMFSACRFEVKSEAQYETTTNETVVEDDTIDRGETEEVLETPSIPDLSSTPSSSSSSSSRSSSSISYSNSSSSSTDNMRHFDPASEDDMDDNGMSRYMDNYDDEGWD